MFSRHVRSVVVLTSMLVILIAQPAPCQRPTGFFENVEKAQWNAVFVGFEREFQFENVNELSRCMWMASGHLGNHNQEAFEYRKKLGPSDWDAAASEARSAEQFRSKPGEFLLNAAIMVAHGDYISAWRLSGSGLKTLHADTLAIARMDQYEVGAALRVHRGFMGMAAVAGFLYGGPIPRRDSLAEAYANVGKVYRLLKETEELAKQILDTDLALLVTGESGSTIPDSTSTDSMSGQLDGLIELRKKQAQREHFLYMDTLFQAASELSNAFFNYHWGNLLTRLGREEEAFGKYAQLLEMDYECDLFRRIYVEKVGAKNGHDAVLKRMKKTSEVSGAPLNAPLWVNECYIVQGKPDKAISEGTKFLKTNPGHIYALSQRARAYQAKGDMVHATEDARAVLTADTTNYDGWYVLGLTAQAGADPMARQYLEKAVSYAPEGLSIATKAQAALEAMK